jgi:hypothetical protein
MINFTGCLFLTKIELIFVATIMKILTYDINH